MAMITPFADPNAHGKIAGTFCFRRKKNGIVLQKNRYSGKTATQEQLDSRDTFEAGTLRWNSMSGIDRQSWKNHALNTRLNAFQFFMHEFCLGRTPGTTPVLLKEITAASLINIRESESHAILYKAITGEPYLEYGLIYDNENTWNDQHQYDAPGKKFLLTVYNSTGNLNLIRLDGLNLTWITGADKTQNIRIRVPQYSASNYLTLYIATDGSTYYDAAMTQLAVAAGE